MNTQIMRDMNVVLIFFDLVITLYSHVCHPRRSGCKAKNVHYRPNYFIMSCYLQNSRSSMSFSIIQNIRCMPFVVIISNRKLICQLVHGKACSQEHTTKKTDVTIRLGIELKSIDYILGSIVNTIGKTFCDHLKIKKCSL